jgi:BASS family bile acid:Na+ symporter
VDLKQAVTLVLQLALILTVGSVGLRANWHDVVNTIARPVGLLRSIVAINIVVPAVAVLMGMALPLPPAIKFGIVIMAVSPLAPFVPGKLIKAGAEASRITGLYAILIALTVAIVPATIWLLNRLFTLQVTTPVRAIAVLELGSVLAPLTFGMVVAAIAPTLARRIAGPAALVAAVVLGIALVAIVVSQAPDIMNLIGNGAVLAMVVTTAAAVVAGHLLGGSDPTARNSLAMAAATRHPGIAAMIAKANSDDRRILLTIMLFLLTSVVVTSAYQLWLKRLDRRVEARALAS